MKTFNLLMVKLYLDPSLDSNEPFHSFLPPLFHSRLCRVLKVFGFSFHPIHLRPSNPNISFFPFIPQAVSVSLGLSDSPTYLNLGFFVAHVQKKLKTS